MPISNSGLILPTSAVDSKLEEVYNAYPKLRQSTIKHSYSIAPEAKDLLMKNEEGFWTITVFKRLTDLGVTNAMGLQMGLKVDQNARTMVPYPDLFYGKLIDVIIYAADKVPDFVFEGVTGNLNKMPEPIFLNPETGEKDENGRVTFEPKVVE